MKRLIPLMVLLLVSSCVQMGRRVSLPESVINPRPHFFDEHSIDTPGLNIAGEEEDFDTLLEAKRLGVSFVILTPSKWASAIYPNQPFTFLLGKNINYEGLIKEDVDRLRRVLDWASLFDLRVVLSFLVTPGFDPNNSQRNTLFVSNQQQMQALQFFYDVALHVGNHDALAAINPLAIPTPEEVGLIFDRRESHQDWYQKVHNRDQDLNKFHRAVVKSIRRARNQLPIILSAGLGSHPEAFDSLEPILDNDILYAFRWPNATIRAEDIEKELAPVVSWQKKYDIGSDRILVSSFAINRAMKGAEEALKNLSDAFRRHKFLHAVSSFREKGEEKTNIELSNVQENPTFWQALKEHKWPHYHKLAGSEFLSALSLKRIVFQQPIRAFLASDPDEPSLENLQLAIEKKNLQQNGFNTIILDNSWQSPDLTEEKIAVESPAKFPHGLKVFIDQAKNKKFAVGLAVTMGMRNSDENISGTLGYETRNAKSLSDHGIDLLLLREGYVDDSEEWDPEILYATLHEWHKNLANTHVKLFADTNTHQHWFYPLVRVSRTPRKIKPTTLHGPVFTSVLVDEFATIVDAARINCKKFLLNSENYSNFPGYLNLGSRIDPIIEKTYIAMWAIMGASFIVAAHPDQLSDTAINCLNNEALMRIQLDQYEPGRLLVDKDNVMIFRKYLSTGETVFLVVNLRDTTLKRKFSPGDLNALTNSTISSVFDQKIYTFKDGFFEIELNPRESELILLK